MPSKPQPQPEKRTRLRSEHRFGPRGGKAHVIDDPATFKALLDPLRHRIIGLLDAPKSIRELADELGLPAGRLYYHLDVLVERGLVKVADHRTSGTNVERVFTRTADRFTFSDEIAQSPLARSRAVSQLERSVTQHLADFTAAEGEKPTPGKREQTVRMGVDIELELTAAQAKRLAARIQDVLREFGSQQKPATKAANTRLYGFLGLLHPKGKEKR